MIKVANGKTEIEGSGVELLNEYANITARMYESVFKDVFGDDAEKKIREIFDMAIGAIDDKDSLKESIKEDMKELGEMVKGMDSDFIESLIETLRKGIDDGK